MKSCQSIFSVSLCLAVFPLHADLGPIVITGTKTEVPASQSAVPVEVITSQQIRNSVATDVADIIQLHSNVDVARNGDYGKTTSVFMRGAESNHTLVLIDGVKINPGTIALPALQNISPDIVERIEIVKGPRSSIYGSEAIGGVINIITRKNIDGQQLKLIRGSGADGTRKTGASAYYGNDKISGGVNLEQFDTDGFPVTDASDEDHGFDNSTVNAFLDFQMENSEIRISHWMADGNVEYFSFGDLDQDFENQASSVVWDYAINGQLNSNLRISSITDEIQQNQPNFLSQLDFATTERTETEFKLDYRTEYDLSLSLGILSAKEEVDALSFGTSIDETTDINATYVVLQSLQDMQSYSVALRQTDHEDFGNNTTWNVDFKRWLSNSTNIHAGAGTAFRAPDHTDRFGSIGNPDLEPEVSETIEIGIEHRFSPDDILSVVYFDNEIEDLIEPNATFTQVENLQKAEIKGVEITYQVTRDHWYYNLGLLFQDPQNKVLDEQLSRRTEKRINLNVSYHDNDWHAGANLSLVGERDNSSFDTITLDKYELVNVFLRYQVTKSLDVSAKIENLFDEEYETASGFNTKDRTAFVEVSYSLVN